MILGAVLAGGRSRRFGSDKAMALLDGQTLIDRVIAALAPQVDALLVCGRDMPGVRCVTDRPVADLGPLGGLNAALRYGLDNGFDSVISVPCDAPFVPADLVARLAEAPCIVRRLPVIGRWPCALADTLDNHLAQTDDRSMRAWAALAGAVAVDIDAIGNVNTVDDLARLADR